MQEHIKVMTETFNELAIVGVELSDEDRAVYLLASQPESFNYGTRNATKFYRTGIGNI